MVTLKSSHDYTNYAIDSFFKNTELNNGDEFLLIDNDGCELDKEYGVKRSLALEFGKEYKTQFNKKNIAINIMNLFNLR